MPAGQDAAQSETMTTGRLEAFTDGVVAIIITIMVLELKVPTGHDWPPCEHAGLYSWPMS